MSLDPSALVLSKAYDTVSTDAHVACGDGPFDALVSSSAEEEVVAASA